MNRLPQALSLVFLAVTTSASVDFDVAGQTLVPLILGEALTYVLGISLAEAVRVRSFGAGSAEDPLEVLKLIDPPLSPPPGD